MNHFDYKNGRLHAEDVAIDSIAEKVGTPFYCYSTQTLERHYRILDDSLRDAGVDAAICFAVKANSNVAVIKTLARLGAGADVVSEGELRRALAAGIPPERIVFSGVGKTEHELRFAVSIGLHQINVESEPELEMLSRVAVDLGREQAIAIRVNPDVDANTHEKITTGRKENKFGIEWTDAHRVIGRARSMPGLRVAGVACHIGSQLTEMQPFKDAFIRIRDLAAMLKADGFAIERLDLGGGLGVPYQDEILPGPGEYAKTVAAILGDLGCKIMVEPGRLLAGNAGVLVTRVISVKEGATRTFVIVDAAMNDLIRPALYDAYHQIDPVKKDETHTTAPVDVVGPVCETGDTFAKQRLLPPVKAGDLLALRTAGAYGASMASMYNTRPLVPEVLVKGDLFRVVRKRPSYEEILAMESLPEWLEG